MVYLNFRWYLGKFLKEEFGWFQDFNQPRYNFFGCWFSVTLAFCLSTWSLWDPKSLHPWNAGLWVFSGFQKANQQSWRHRVGVGGRPISLSPCKLTEASVLLGLAGSFSPGYGNTQSPTDHKDLPFIHMSVWQGSSCSLAHVFFFLIKGLGLGSGLVGD